MDSDNKKNKDVGMDDDVTVVAGWWRVLKVSRQGLPHDPARDTNRVCL